MSQVYRTGEIPAHGLTLPDLNRYLGNKTLILRPDYHTHSKDLKLIYPDDSIGSCNEAGHYNYSHGSETIERDIISGI